MVHVEDNDATATVRGCILEIRIGLSQSKTRKARLILEVRASHHQGSTIEKQGDCVTMHHLFTSGKPLKLILNYQTTE